MNSRIAAWNCLPVLFAVLLTVACGRNPIAQMPATPSPTESGVPSATPIPSATPTSSCANPSKPSARGQETLTYVPNTDELVLFGGLSNTSNDTYRDTWLWHAGCWTQAAPATSPGFRYAMRAAYDPVTGSVIAYGGWYWARNATQATVFADTWQWNGVTWTQVASTGPSLDGEMAFDPSSGEVILVGLSQQRRSMETWVWRGGAWTQLHPANSPSVRVQAGLAGDPVRKQVVLFGGFDQSFGYHNDTWIWNGSTWLQSSQTNAPSGRLDPPMAFDAATGQIVLQGGGGPRSLLQDTWTWDGQRWAKGTDNQTQFHSTIQSTECGIHVCAVEAGQRVWQWQAGSWSLVG